MAEDLPDASAIECVRRLKTVLSQVAILLLADRYTDEGLFGALAAGASGYLLTQGLTHSLHQAIQETARGGAWLCPQAMCRVVAFCAEVAQAPHATERLTRREFQVLSLVAKGLSNKQIAVNLRIETGTVHAHLGHIFDKLNVTSRTAAAVQFVTGVTHAQQHPSPTARDPSAM